MPTLNTTFNRVSNALCNRFPFHVPTIEPMHETMDRLYKAAEELRGISGQSDLARYLNASPQTLNNWEARGMSKAGMLSAQEIIGCSAVWLATGRGVMQPISDNSEIVELWSKLPPEEQAVLLPLIRLRASMHTTTQPAAQDRRQDELPVGTERRFIRPGTFSFHQTDNPVANKAKHDKKK